MTEDKDSATAPSGLPKWAVGIGFSLLGFLAAFTFNTVANAPADHAAKITEEIRALRLAVEKNTDAVNRQTAELATQTARNDSQDKRLDSHERRLERLEARP